MEEMELQERPGPFARLTNLFVRHREDEYVEEPVETAAPRMVTMRNNARYHVTVRRMITQFEDALAAADGLKRGEQQILNLSSTEPSLRQKVVDFMCGVNFAQDGHWEEVGDHIFLIVPAGAYVEVAPANMRSSALRN